MATAEFSATAGNLRATAKNTNLVGSTSTLATTADTDVGTVQTDMTTAFTDADLFGANVIATTGDTYSNTTHKFTFGGATGLTHAQWATAGALYNTAIGAFVTAQTDLTAAKAATAAAKAAALAIASDVLVYIGSTTNVTDINVLRDCLNRIVDRCTGVIPAGNANPRALY